jgi:hypothetical protein
MAIDDAVISAGDGVSARIPQTSPAPITTPRMALTIGFEQLMML